MKTAKKIIELAQSWIGKKEKDGSHKEIVDIYNSHKPLARGYKVKYTDSWCAATISALSIKLDYTDIIPIECGCEEMIKLFNDIGCWFEDENRTPNVGDIIFYDWDDNGVGDNKGWSDHVGIVEKVEDGVITVIEGNKSDAVGRREIKVNAKKIRGYGVPKYGEEKDLLEVDGKWGKDTTTKTQILFGTKVDGIVSHQNEKSKERLVNCSTKSWEFDDTRKGSKLIRAIQKFLTDLKYYNDDIDGLCGKNTIMAIQQFLKDRAFYRGEINGKMDEATVKAWQNFVNNRL